MTARGRRSSRDEIPDIGDGVDVACRRFLLQRFDLAGVLVIARHRESVVSHVQ